MITKSTNLGGLIDKHLNKMFYILAHHLSQVFSTYNRGHCLSHFFVSLMPSSLLAYCVSVNMSFHLPLRCYTSTSFRGKYKQTRIYQSYFLYKLAQYFGLYLKSNLLFFHSLTPSPHVLLLFSSASCISQGLVPSHCQFILCVSLTTSVGLSFLICNMYVSFYY